MSTVNVLAVGDIVGRLGREALLANLPTLQEQCQADFTIVNIENAAGGFGVTKKTYQQLQALDVDVFTSGNHIYDKREFTATLDQYPNLIRPINFAKGSPGVGRFSLTKKGVSYTVINAIGRVFMNHSDCPFQALEKEVESLKEDVSIVDFHAETTSEKQAMGWFLDGRVSAMYGTHTHIQTADDRILNQGTGYLTDVGMTGAYDGVIGMKREAIVKKFIDQLPTRFEVPAEGPAIINAICFTIDLETKKTVGTKRLFEIYS